MSNINDWKAKISGAFKSKDITDGLDNLEKSIAQCLIPTLSQLDDARPFKSDFYKDYGHVYVKELENQKFKFKGQVPQDSVELMFQLASNLLVVLPWLRHELKGKVITTEGLELRNANLLQMVDLANWTVDYVTNFTNVLTVAEVTAAGGKSKSTPTIEESIQGDLWIFIIACQVLLKPLNDIKAAYGRVPALVADYDKFQELSQSIGLSKVDPLNLSKPPFPLTLFFYPQMLIADVQMTQLEKSEASYKAINYRLALLKRMEATGTSDAATEKKIEAYEAELSKLERNIKRKKDKWNLA